MDYFLRVHLGSSYFGSANHLNTVFVLPAEERNKVKEAFLEVLTRDFNFRVISSRTMVEVAGPDSLERIEVFNWLIVTVHVIVNRVLSVGSTSLCYCYFAVCLLLRLLCAGWYGRLFFLMN